MTYQSTSWYILNEKCEYYKQEFQDYFCLLNTENNFGTINTIIDKYVRWNLYSKEEN